MTTEKETLPARFLTGNDIARIMNNLITEKGLDVSRCRFKEKTQEEKSRDPNPDLKQTIIESVGGIKPPTAEDRYGTYLLVDFSEGTRYRFELFMPLSGHEGEIRLWLDRLSPLTLPDEIGKGFSPRIVESRVEFTSSKATSYLEEPYGEIDHLQSAFFNQLKQ